MIRCPIGPIGITALLLSAGILPCNAEPLSSESMLPSEASALKQLRRTKFLVDFRSASMKAKGFPHGRHANPSAILRASFLRNLLAGDYVPVPDGGFSIIFARIRSEADDLWELQAGRTLNFQGCAFVAMPAPTGKRAACLILSKSHWNRDLLFNKCRFEADVGLSQCSVSKLLSIKDSFFAGDLDLSSSAVGTYILLEGNEIKGGLKANNVRVQNNVNLAHTDLQSPAIVEGVVDFENLKVGGSFQCSNLRTPELVLRGATVDGNVTLIGRGIDSLRAQDLSVKRTMWLGQQVSSAWIDLSVSTVDRLRVSSLSILAKTNLRELVLNRISVDDPKAWTIDHLRDGDWAVLRDLNLPNDFLKRLEEAMSRAGEQAVSDEIYIFRRRSLAERSDGSTNIVDWFLFAMTGYGRQPARLLVWLLPVFGLTLWWVGVCGKPLPVSRSPSRDASVDTSARSGTDPIQIRPRADAVSTAPGPRNFDWKYWPLLIWSAVDHLLPLAQLKSETAWELDPPTLAYRNFGALLSLCGLVLSITAVGLIATFFLGR
ncbi:MAG: hypothetical protein HONBIEJF_02525 [Fimbriimonadaceae bacterium]|nr:hypothetical protein [Fimbriimonadaceae bacterium]